MYLRFDFDRDFKEGGIIDTLLRTFLVPFSFILMSINSIFLYINVYIKYRLLWAAFTRNQGFSLPPLWTRLNLCQGFRYLFYFLTFAMDSCSCLCEHGSCHLLWLCQENQQAFFSQSKEINPLLKMLQKAFQCFPLVRLRKEGEKEASGIMFTQRSLT